MGEALREAEELIALFPVLYPSAPILRLAMRGVATYGLSWFDAHMWAYAEHHGLSPLYSEDLQHDALYGTVRIFNPFL
jgi:predicted nucleic acid-binding protein